MSFYLHDSTLAMVAPEDRPHVDRMLDFLDAYARSEGSRPLGRFLTAVVVGDLFEAAIHADDTNVKYLREFVKYVYNRLPGMHIMLAEPVLAIVRQCFGGKPPLTREAVTRAAKEFMGTLRRVMED